MADKLHEGVHTLKKFETFYEDNVSHNDVVKGYENWAKNGLYDADFAAISHRGHLMIADLLEEYFPDHRADVHVLDIAAGTGRVGVELHTRGFRKLDALDPCGPMLEEAKKKNVYDKLIEARVGGEQLDIADGTYDAISCCAAFVEGHLPAEAIIELVRLVKKGGIIAMVGNSEYWDTIPEYSGKMATEIERMHNKGEINTVKKEIREGFIGDKYNAIVIVLQKQ